MNKKQLRAIHAQACAAVARAGQKLSPAEDRFWIAYIPAVLAAAKPVREFIPYTGEANFLAEVVRRYFVPAATQEPEPDAALPGAENDLVTEIAWLVDNGNCGARTHYALRRAFATLSTIDADASRLPLEAMSPTDDSVKGDFGARDAIADALGLVRGSVSGRKVGYTWSYLISAIKDLREHAEANEEANEASASPTDSTTHNLDDRINLRHIINAWARARDAESRFAAGGAAIEKLRAFARRPKAAISQVTPSWPTAAARDVLAERARQVSEEGWTPTHDDQHGPEELAIAAACYVLHAANERTYGIWPWAASWWKPTTPRGNLVKGAALAMAAIECYDRAAAQDGVQ